MTTIDENRIYPFVPTTSLNEGGLAFVNEETGEILDFPASWRADLDAVEHIIVSNLIGDYEEQAPLFPNWW